VERHIINCHIHTFTVEHVPVDFLPLKLGVVFKAPIINRPARWLLGRMNPFDSRDRFARFANFAAVASEKTQRQVFDIVRSRYPSKTRFVVLPMDMAYMGAGKVPVPLEQQHHELAMMRADLGEMVIPFAAVDPRRPGVLDMLRDLVETKGFQGIKVYPNLGYKPEHPVLMEIWRYAEEKNLPVMTHCSRGGPLGKGVSRDDLDNFTSPACWLPVLRRFPALRVCLAHFGGEAEWERYFGDGWQAGQPNESRSWLADILDHIKSGEFPNLYTDISYTIFRFDEYAPVVKVFLSDPLLRQRVLFGSDFYMTENERFEERLLSMRLRGLLGEDMFWQIASTNPISYLGEAK
jgi:predicted TIM-barrel fold metal-dependent hydrolase